MTYDTIRRISGWLPAALGLGLAILGGVIYGGMLLWPERNAARPRESSWSKTQTPGPPSDRQCPLLAVSNRRLTVNIYGVEYSGKMN